MTITVPAILVWPTFIAADVWALAHFTLWVMRRYERHLDRRWRRRLNGL